MLCITLAALTRACGGISGGIVRLWVFDGSDFDWTQGAAVAGVLPEYTAVARRTGATALGGAKMFPITFATKTAKFSYTQSVKGCSVKYEMTFSFALPDLGQAITNWNQVIDAASCCCGVGVAIQLQTGRILIAGEQYVNAAAIDIPMKIVQDGSTGDSGLLLDDENQQNTVLKGDFSRMLYEFTGGAAALIALQ
jgi:hypothetical protein